jgi:polyphosphate kinase 2 (PPK2 family)
VTSDQRAKDFDHRIRADLVDSFDEELEMEIDDERLDMLLDGTSDRPDADGMDRKLYFKDLFRLQGELVKLQDWVVAQKLKVVVIFEGRDAAGKGGVIKRITQRLNPRICRVAALPAPNERERTQWYFQRYASHLPAAGEVVLFDRSWYNRAGVERVMGFCTADECEESSCAQCRSSSASWCARASSSSSTGSRLPTRSSTSASTCASTIP